jgi:hypothetical protein
VLLPLSEGLVATGRFDGECAELADRHYSRRTVGARQFVYAARQLILRDSEARILFAWLFPDPALRMDNQTGYNCAIFRNESGRPSSEIILEAECRAVAKWGPNRGYTYVDPRHVQSPNPGYCFKLAGWRFVKRTADGKHLLEKPTLGEGGAALPPTDP